jgi:hypothetical protein
MADYIEANLINHPGEQPLELSESQPPSLRGH